MGKVKSVFSIDHTEQISQLCIKKLKMKIDLTPYTEINSKKDHMAIQKTQHYKTLRRQHRKLK